MKATGKPIVKAFVKAFGKLSCKAPQGWPKALRGESKAPQG